MRQMDMSVEGVSGQNGNIRRLTYSVKTFCEGASLESNVIVHSESGAVANHNNCDDVLLGIPPFGVKSFAPC